MIVQSQKAEEYELLMKDLESQLKAAEALREQILEKFRIAENDYLENIMVGDFRVLPVEPLLSRARRWQIQKLQVHLQPVQDRLIRLQWQVHHSLSGVLIQAPWLRVFQ
jgi:hypothetical protein